MDSIYKQDCTRCPLSESRTQIVWSRGYLSPLAGCALMLVGEAPGAEEDRTGFPFMGRSGELLNEALIETFGGAYGTWVYITNMVKCRPPGNRNPTNSEVETCSPFLKQEIEEIVQPKLIVVLGKVAAERFLQRPVKITKEHGNLDFTDDGQAVLICYHPAYVLRNQKPEIKQGFFQAIQDARRIAYGTNDNVHEGSSE